MVWPVQCAVVYSRASVTYVPTMCLQQGDVYMAFEYLEYDLWALANSSQVKLTGTHIKTYMKQMLDAIAYMHTNKVGTLQVRLSWRYFAYLVHDCRC